MDNSQRLILIVEDDIDVRCSLAEILLLENYRVQPAINGAEAFEFLKNGNEKPHLILLDIMMPVMDGIAFCGLLKDFPDYDAIPRIIMSAGGFRSQEVTLLEAKCFLKKPIEIDMLLNSIQKALE